MLTGAERTAGADLCQVYAVFFDSPNHSWTGAEPNVPLKGLPMPRKDFTLESPLVRLVACLK